MVPFVLIGEVVVGGRERSRHLLLRCGLPSELLLNRLYHEVHHGDVVGHAVQLEAQFHRGTQQGSADWKIPSRRPLRFRAAT